ncbi:HGGxSTG domain-containing protein [Bradyrhizobium sp. F1.4.3]|uniref:HGGxSTG domain-containing protein n=1 Tax=Bradyrhizobium sp. F1.4.3 TaxID=3156356 RepID=UPI003391192D
MLTSPRCGAGTRSGTTCRAPAVRGKTRCRMHGGAAGSGAPRKNQNARKHGLFTGMVVAEQRRIQALLRETRKLLSEMKSECLPEGSGG